MTEKPEETVKKDDESLKDYASRRLVELKNYEQQLVARLQQLQQALNDVNTELVATRGVIGEMTRIITPPPEAPSEKP